MLPQLLKITHLLQRLLLLPLLERILVVAVNPLMLFIIFLITFFFSRWVNFLRAHERLSTLHRKSNEWFFDTAIQSRGQPFSNSAGSFTLNHHRWSNVTFLSWLSLIHAFSFDRCLSFGSFGLFRVIKLLYIPQSQQDTYWAEILNLILNLA